MDDVSIVLDDLQRIMDRPAVPGALFGCYNKKGRNEKTEIREKVSQEKASHMKVLFRQMDLTHKSSVAKGELPPSSRRVMLTINNQELKLS